MNALSLKLEMVGVFDRYLQKRGEEQSYCLEDTCGTSWAALWPNTSNRKWKSVAERVFQEVKEECFFEFCSYSPLLSFYSGSDCIIEKTEYVTKNKG